MKNFYIILLFFVLTVLSCKTSPGDPKISGGYEKMDVNSEKVIMLKEFLQKELQIKYPGIEIIKVNSAEAQVVAGYNYMLICDYKIKKTKKVLKAKINEDLKKNLKILELDI